MARLEGFLGELKRRKVVRVAVVYAATAFVVLQVADIMLPRLGVPEWGMSLVVLLTVLGFPISLVLAWALEVTPDGIQRSGPGLVGRGSSSLNMSSDAESDYFADGTSAFKFKGQNEDLRVIGEQLGVTHILLQWMRENGESGEAAYWFGAAWRAREGA